MQRKFKKNPRVTAGGRLENVSCEMKLIIEYKLYINDDQYQQKSNSEGNPKFSLFII